MLSIEQYTLKDPNQIAQTHRYTIKNIDNNAQLTIDEAKNIYIVTPHQSLSIYQIVDEQPSQVSTLELNATKIVNITDTQLYAYGNRTIYQVDTTNPYAPRLLSSFNFEQTTNDLYFDEQILYTPRYMIDTDALMLSFALSYYRCHTGFQSRVRYRFGNHSRQQHLCSFLKLKQSLLYLHHYRFNIGLG
jgi:hypothetical protein